MAISKQELCLLKEVTTVPTGPFCEMATIAYVKNWAEKNEIEYHSDPFGNLLLKYPGAEKTDSPWVLQAHLDHPGFAVIKQQGTMVRAQFRGHVLPQFFEGESVRFFPKLIGHPDPSKMENHADGFDKFASVKGRILSVKLQKKTRFSNCQIELDREEMLKPGTLGMWDLPAWRQNGKKLSLRASDDVVGTALVLTAIQRLKKANAKRPVYGLLTRCEEPGFIGAMAVAEHGTIKKSWPVLGIETSKAQPFAPLGGGAVIRVGDKLSVFDPTLNFHLDEAAKEVMKRKGINVIRALMQGGSTESTLLGTLGFQTCATCLPLGNYHNMGKNRIRPEQIHLDDYNSLVSLLVAVSQRTPDNTPAERFADRIREHFANVTKAASF